MYWYNPKTQTSQRVTDPSDDEEAIRMLAGHHPNSATLVSEYAELRRSDTPIESPGVGGPRVQANAARVHDGAAAGARPSGQEGETEYHWVRACLGGAPSRRRQGSTKGTALLGEGISETSCKDF
jgi:hypothetical protein